MNIELGILNDGGVVFTSDSPLPEVVKRVEYYRDQKLFMLVYSNDGDDQLMDYEIPEDMAEPIEKSPNIIIYTLFKDHAPVGYKVPLIKVGELY